MISKSDLVNLLQQVDEDSVDSIDVTNAEKGVVSMTSITIKFKHAIYLTNSNEVIAEGSQVKDGS